MKCVHVFMRRMPTLVLAECVLVYLEPDESRKTLEWVASTFSNVGIMVYEQVSSLT